MDPRGLRLTQNAYFSFLTHTKQLLLVTFCDNLAGIEVSFRTHGRTNGTMDRQTWKSNSYLDADVHNSLGLTLGRCSDGYPLRGYILCVLTHTTAWDRLWGNDVFKIVSM